MGYGNGVGAHVSGAALGYGQLEPGARESAAGKTNGSLNRVTPAAAQRPRLTRTFSRLSETVQNGWRRLCHLGSAARPQRTRAEITSPSPSQRSCPKETVVKSTLGVRNITLHANTIQLNGSAAECAEDRTAIVGANPVSLEQAFTVLGEGTAASDESHIFQFVSLRRLQDPQKRAGTLAGIVEQLTKGGCPWDDAFAIESIETLPSDRRDVETLRLTLTSCSEWDEGEEQTVVVTLAGYDFSAGVLSRDDLLHAYDRFTTHLPNDGPDRANQTPIFLSKAGIGRSAALMVLNELMIRHETAPFSDKQALLDEMNAIIQTGRRDRDPNFVHNKGQYQAILEAALVLADIEG